MYFGKNWILFILSYMLLGSEGLKILVLFPIPARSHCNLGDGIVRHLLKAGHEITYITPFPDENANPNLRQISVADNLKALVGRQFDFKSFIKSEPTMDQESIFQLTMNILKKTMGNPDVLKLLNDQEEKFDVVIMEWMFTEIYCGFSAVFNCPFIWSFPYEPNFVGLSLIDEATSPAYTSNVLYNDIQPSTFTQRAIMLYKQITHRIKYKLFYEGVENDLYESIFKPILEKRGRVLPPYSELKYNASLMFGNSHVSLGEATRLPQNYISIAGHYIDDVKPLPTDLQDIMDNAKDGVIYFSLGSNLKSKDIPADMKDGLIKVFEELKQTVIWKFEEELSNLPKNVHAIKWAPQSSILAHPNCLLFITHGGLLSTTEAVHFAVPLIGIPFFIDQNFNVNQYVKKGVGLEVVLSENLVEDLKSAIHVIINDSSYRKKMKELSFVYHHRPVPPGKELVHWVEHVVKTNGALYYRSPALWMPWYQKMFLDLAALIASIAFVVIYVFSLLCNRKRKIEKKKTS